MILKCSNNAMANIKRLAMLKMGNLSSIYEQGLIDQKIEKSINLPIFTRNDDMRFYNLAIPTYQASNFVEKPLLLND